MSKCKGLCKKQEYQIRNMKVVKVVGDKKNPVGCASVDQVLQSREAEEACVSIENELRKDEWLKQCENKNCKCSLENTGFLEIWGEWIEGETEGPLTAFGCKYTIFCKYESRSRIRKGACVNSKYLSTAIGIIGDQNIVVRTGDKTCIEPDKLEEIKDILY